MSQPMTSSLAAIAVVSERRICTSCHHVATSVQGWERFRCLSPNNLLDETVNLVNGEVFKRWKAEFCKDNRANANFCGPSGAWFEERRFEINTQMAEKPKESKRSNKITADDL
jgi:hypothetical protein